jgi:hypothetical protein
MCYHYMTFTARMHKWKRIISKKWFLSTIEKHKLKLYNYCTDDKSKMDYNAFKSQLGTYGYGYRFLGGGKLNHTGSTIINIE